MCPSYRATREERYSTRGRARLLSEMLRGEVITDGWQSEEVQGGARLCLALQGLPQRLPDAYRHGRLQGRVPVALLRNACGGRARRESMGRIGEWAPLASRLPGLANAVSPFGKSLAGVASGRSLPRFHRAFRTTFAPGGQHGRKSRPVRRHVQQPLPPADGAVRADAARSGGLRRGAAARARVLRAAVLRLGMLDRAKAALDRVLDVLPPGVPGGDARAGLPFGVPRMS